MHDKVIVPISSVISIGIKTLELIILLLVVTTKPISVCAAFKSV